MADLGPGRHGEPVIRGDSLKSTQGGARMPFSRQIDLERGTIEGANVVVERRLSDLADAFAIRPQEDVIVYRVYGIAVPPTTAELASSTTVLLPGKVGEEYFMTKGHLHAVRDRAELYPSIRGEGLLLMADERGRAAVEPIGPGTVAYVPGGWAHRAANTSARPLLFFCTYVADAGHDYDTVARRGFPVRVVEGPDGPRVVEVRETDRP